MSTIAVMQPYLWPYAGYYRLLVASDVFVVYDCVQFIRRGRIHRNEFDTVQGTDWFTLPLAKPAFTDRIDAVRLADDAPHAFSERLRPFPRLAAGWQRALQSVHGDNLAPTAGMLLVDLLVAQLRWAARCLGLNCAIERSSYHDLPADLRGEDRIIALCERYGARRYVNVDGGRALYDPARFARHGVRLGFLAPHRGPFSAVLERLADGPEVDAAAREVRAEIDANLVMQ
jgi:hypothetical protein